MRNQICAKQALRPPLQGNLPQADHIDNFDHFRSVLYDCDAASSQRLNSADLSEGDRL